MRHAQAKPTGLNQGDLVNLLKALRNRIFTDGGLAMGTTTTQVKITNNTQYALDGQNYLKAAADNIAVTGLTNTGAGQFCKVRVEINAAGTVSFVQGGFAANQPVAKMPTRSASKTTLGWIEIPASFVFGTTDFNVAGVTFFDGDRDLDLEHLQA